jgi:hypothetical protein
MKILDYIASLVPNFDKQRILNNVAALQTELGSTTLKSYEEAGNLFKAKKLKSSWNNEFDKNFHATIHGDRNENFVLAIANILKTVPAKLGFLESLIASDFSKDVTRDALTYKKATVLKYLELVQFVQDYGNRLLIKVMALETDANDPGDKSNPSLDNAPMAIRNWMAKNERAFLDALAVLSMPLAEVKEKIESIPDINAVPENAGIVSETVGGHRIDPLGLGFIVTTWMNPIFHVRMAFAEWQVERYKAKQEEKKMLEFRLLALQESYEKKKDPKLQQVIEYTDGRLQSLNRKLSEIESEYAA